MLHITRYEDWGGNGGVGGEVFKLEEVPNMVKLDAVQLEEFMALILGAESIVDSSCRKDGSRANSDEPVVLAHDRI